MRKLIKIIIVLIILFGILIIDLPQILASFGIDEELKDYLVKTINEQNEKIVSIEDITISFWEIELNNIKIISSTDKAQFVVKNAKFDYNLWNLITDSSNPQNAITGVSFIEPKLIIKQMEESESTKQSEKATADSIKSDFYNSFTKFANIDKIFLRDARIILQKEAGDFIVLADDLNGWLQRSDSSNITVNTTGSILYGKNNFGLFLDLDPVKQKLNGRIELADYHINNSKFLISKPDLPLNSGIFDGRLYFLANSFEFDSLFINGYINIYDLDASYYNATLSDFNGKIVVNHNHLKIYETSGKLNGSQFDLAGDIYNLFKPEFIGELSSADFKLNSLESFVDDEGFNGSSVNIVNRFKISAKDTSAKISITSPRITYNKQIINDLSVQIQYRNGVIEVDKIDVNFMDYLLTSKGTVNIHNGGFTFNIDGMKDYSDHYFFDKLNSRSQYIEVDLSGNIFDKSMDGDWYYRIYDSSDTLFNINGKVNLRNDLFNFSMNRSFKNDFLFSVQIANIFSSPEINFGYIENLPFHLFTSRKWLKTIYETFTFEGILVGPFNKLNTEISFYSRKSPDDRLVLNWSIVDILKTEKSITGNWNYKQFKGNAEAKIGENYLLGLIKSENSIDGRIDLDLLRKQQLTAFLKFSDFDINRFFADTTFNGYGQINGIVSIAGDIDHPVIDANLYGDKFVLHDVGYYKVAGKLHAENNNLELDSLNISLNNMPILDGVVEIDFESKKIDAVAYGENVDADYIVKTIFGKNEVITGEAAYTLTINGLFTEPAISAQIDFKNGKFDKIGYDEIQIELGDSIPSKNNYLDYKNHLINIKKLKFVKNGHFHFESNGTYPLYANGKIGLDLIFNGDILSLIPNWSEFFVDGASFSTISLKIAGTPDKPRILEGLINIEQGELWLKSVAEHIDGISGEISIAPGSNEVEFKDFIASIDGNPLKINTVRNVKTISGEELKNWYFRDFDLDFGVLTLETGPKGIELQIPSLMVDNETGFLALSGKEEGEKFYFAGPVKHPTARGTVLLSDSRISYPFPKRQSMEKDVAEEFLENMQWDIKVFAGRDLKYERQISAFLGEVNTELFLNPEVDGIEFTGIINNNSFRANGALNSDRGRLEYLDLNFRVESFGVEFNESNQKPRVYGRAWTIVRDSVDAIPKTIYLELYAIDPETGQEIQNSRWEDFRFRLVSADPTIGETQEQVLSYLGYSVKNIKNKATEVGGAVTENYLIRPLLRPIERSLERYLGFDLVRFNSNIARNIFHVSLGQTLGSVNPKLTDYNLKTNVPYLLLFESSELTVGKYLSRDLYLTYTGQLVATAFDQENQFNFNHSFGLEYRFFKNILLELEYDREILDFYENYSNKPYLEDFKIRLRHSFTF